MSKALLDWLLALGQNPSWERVDGLAFTAPRFSFTPVRTQYYGHGAFMGAAPALVSDPLWRRILAFLMPDVFEDVRAKLDEGAELSTLMTMLENNPILAAFGTWRSAQTTSAEEHPNHLAGLEWDVFVDTELVEAHASAASQDEADAVMRRVVDTALIAHAGALDTVQESLGFSQYADVRATEKTALGGVEMDAWLDLFGRALFLASAKDFAAASSMMAQDPRVDSDEPCMRFTFARPWPVDRVVDVYQQVTGRPHLSIIIDMKSLHSTAHFLSALVTHLNGHGVHVAAVGSFNKEEIAGVGTPVQRVRGTVLPGPREVRFFHFAGDLRLACRAGEVTQGESVMFNGASLLDFKTTGPGQHEFTPKQAALEGLEQLRRRLDLQIGIYVQEGDCEAKAVAALSDTMEACPDTFSLGFAWGGLRDEAGMAPGNIAKVGFGGQSLLFLVGEAIPWELAAED